MLVLKIDKLEKRVMEIEIPLVAKPPQDTLHAIIAGSGTVGDFPVDPVDLKLLGYLQDFQTLLLALRPVLDENPILITLLAFSKKVK